MTQDANDSIDEKVLTPSLNPNATGIEEHMAKMEAEQPQESSEPIAESSPASEENHEEKSNGFQKRINKVTAEKYAEQRRADELEQKIRQLESQAPASQEPVVEVAEPKLPTDVYDEEAMQQYHKDMLKYNSEAAKTYAKQQFESQQKAVSERQAKEQQQKTMDKWTSNAMRDGVDLDKLRVAEQTLNNAGISAELGQFIMNDNNGAKVAEYLADNPSEMYEVLQLNPVEAGIKIATQIKPKVLSETPKVSKAPDPIPEVKGGGHVEVDDFDKTYAGYEIL